MTTSWQGVFPAVTTKMDQTGRVDLAATQTSIERLIENGVSGLIVLPMLGENASLTLDEREGVIRAALEAAIEFAASGAGSLESARLPAGSARR